MAKPLVNVTAALFCERVLTEPDGVNTIIRAVDSFSETFKVAADGPLGTPEVLEDARRQLETGPVSTNLTFFVALWAEDDGECALRVSFDYEQGEPSGKPYENSIAVRKGQGVNLKLVLVTPFPRQGRLWATVTVNGETRTRSPLTLSRKVEL